MPACKQANQQRTQDENPGAMILGYGDVAFKDRFFCCHFLYLSIIEKICQHKVFQVNLCKKEQIEAKSVIEWIKEF